MRVDYDDVETEDDLRVTYQGDLFTGEVVQRAPQDQVIALSQRPGRRCSGRTCATPR